MLWLSRFFEKNLLERIIIYLFLSGFLVKLIFELILGQWGFVQSQNIQWIFYGLLCLDYIISFRKCLNIRITINMSSCFSLVLFIMILHGIFVGIMNNNQTFVIFNDTVPLLMIALNILRMQSLYENTTPINFPSLFKTCTLLAFFSVICGYIAVGLGKPSGTGIIAGSIYYPLLFTAFIVLRPFPKWLGLMAMILLLLSIPEMNRTSMAFCATIIVIRILLSLHRDPMKGILLFLIMGITISIFWLTLPKDSGTYTRIMGLTEIDLSSRTGSIGERQAEWDAITVELNRNGHTIEWFGLGFGGVYEAQFTHQYVKNYGHAHYSWSWFKLRYGYIGFIYLGFMALTLLYNLIYNLRQKTDIGIFIGLLNFISILYCGTYVNAVFLMSGIQFFYSQPLAEHKNNKHKDSCPDGIISYNAK